MKISNLYAKSTQKLSRIIQSPSQIRSELSFLKRWAGLESGDTQIVDCQGLNWDKHPEKPILFLWKINHWKKPFLLPYLDEYRVAYVRFGLSPKIIKRKYPYLFDDNYLFGVWGNSAPSSVQRFADENQIKLIRVEDGFLRSLGTGVKHSRPLSLVFDSSGLYYDAAKSNDLQQIMDTVDLNTDTELAAQASDGVAIFKAAKLTKYYPFMFETAVELPSPPARKKGLPPKLQNADNAPSILVVGQMEKDASIAFGTKQKQLFFQKRYSNKALLERAKAENPKAKIYFKPHPDAGKSQAIALLRSPDLTGILTVPDGISVPQAAMQVDKVYTQTSLSGLEAIINDTSVKTIGCPFYAGRGLTDDCITTPERVRALSIDEIFAASYLQYPRYIHPNSDSLCTYFDVAGHFIVMQVLNHRFYAMPEPEKWLDFQTLEGVDRFLPPSARLAIHLVNRTEDGTAKPDPEFMQEILDESTPLRDYPSIMNVLGEAFSPDNIVAAANRVLDILEHDFDTFSDDKTLLQAVFESFYEAQRNFNGRVSRPIPNLNNQLLSKFADDKSYRTVINLYVRCLASALQYSLIDELTFEIKLRDLTDLGLFQSITNTLKSQPTRSERAPAKRRELLARSAGLMRASLNTRYPSEYDLFLNAALVGVATDNLESVENYWDRFNATFGKVPLNIHSKKAARLGMLARRESDFYKLFDFFVKKGRYERAKTMLDENLKAPRSRGGGRDIRRFSYAKIVLAAAQAKHLGVIRLFSDSNNQLKDHRSAQLIFARSLRSTGQLAASVNVLEKALDTSVTLAQTRTTKLEIDKVRFCLEASNILRSVPQPRIPKGVVFIASQTCFNTLAMMIPALYVLKKKGYAVINLLEGMTEPELTGIDYIDKFIDSIPVTFYQHNIQHDWHVNWEDRNVTASGINFYQGFYEGLSTKLRIYDVDINGDDANRRFILQIKRADLCLSICESIYSEVTRRNVNTLFISGNAHVTPFSIFRDFARAKDDPRLGFINCNVAYESYFSNLGSKFASTMCVTDMTLHKNRRAPFMAIPEKFEAWYETNKDDAELAAVAEKMINTNRNSSSSDKTEKEIIAWLSAERKKGKKVLCAFGKVPVDLNVPYDGGPAHIDMKDWLNDTIVAAGKSKDTILLIKPHPHELRPEIALDLIDKFEDLIEVEIPDNVRVLGHKDINVNALAPHLDLALLWNGSSSLELTAVGISVLMASHFGNHDYPVDMIYPESREQYHAYIKAGEFKQPTPEERRRAAFVISYLGTSEVSTLNEYSYRQLTNDKVGMPRWRWSEVERLLNEGDPAMEIIADRMIEKFTGVSR